MGYHLFEVVGIELEYMITHQETLDVLPVCDQLLKRASGKDEPVAELEFGSLGWSNELVNHVVEFKTLAPCPAGRLAELPDRFHRQILRAVQLLEESAGRLMPGAMHPWMDPLTQTVLWPEEYNEIYETYNRIFNCRGHGWSNLQSTHINLPFSGDDEFGRLHAAIRFLMPLMPALTASSPIADGKPTGIADFRLKTYRGNAARVPSVTGSVIPEAVFTRRDYEQEIFEQMYRDIAPHDPEGILRHEWLNSRGAIARFDRGAIEIRILDIQEYPSADIEIAMLIVAVLKKLCDINDPGLRLWDAAELDGMLRQTTRSAGRTRVENDRWLKQAGLKPGARSASAVWEELYTGSGLSLPAVEKIIKDGCLADRMTRWLDGDYSENALRALGAALCDCLSSNRPLP